ncbi:hypothetical protein P7K49_030561 [Saguinus oedipus]|uniref:Uncharacterized protein n=1 Tax=Saguinus oedipus TaxID=9490 RepID=A0ABQ9U2H7_SAGOE|nr:hypothetical protein P7K49_030561 [Saguinus oedipus]
MLQGAVSQSSLSSTGLYPGGPTMGKVERRSPAVSSTPGLVLEPAQGEESRALLSVKKAHGEEKENLTAQALDLSLKYHFVTPLTSMVVTKPEDNEDERAIADKPGEGGDRDGGCNLEASL